MSLVNKVKEHCRAPSQNDQQRYRCLLRANAVDEQSLQELQSLMLKLNKRAEDVEADQFVVARAVQLRGTIDAGRKLDDEIRKASAACDQHRADTAKLIAERDDRLRNLDAARASLLGTRNAAIAAINDLNDLKGARPDLLDDVQAITVRELD